MSENDGGTDRESHDDITQLRESATILRDDSSSLTGSSWRSGEIVRGDDGMEAPKVLKQRFVLEDRLGSGGMGTVFRAKDLRKVEARDSQPHIAIKVLNNDFRSHPQAFIALEREASKSQSFRHPNIVSIFDFDKDADVPFITMELLEGEELASLLRNFPNGLPEEQAWSVIEGMVRGLEHAHDQGVVHADFKPGNVFTTDDGQTKILDFGIARAMRANTEDGEEQDDADFDPARLAALTPAYASREMLNGDNPEPRDDLFSLGVVAYMVLTGHHPYGRVPANQAAQEGLKPERIKGVSRRRWRTIEKCLQFNRQQRPASAREVLDHLFGKSAWPSWALASAAAVALVAVALASFQEAQVIDEVKEEVRQETLVDAQLARLGQLLAEPKYDTAWLQLLYSEYETLRVLAPRHQVHGNFEATVEELIAEHVKNATSLEEAIERLNLAQGFGKFPHAVSVLEERLADEIDSLVAQPLDDLWLARAGTFTRYAELYFPVSAPIEAARTDLADYGERNIGALIESGEVELAQAVWRTVSNDVFEVERWAQTDATINEAIQNVQAKEQARARANSEKQAFVRVDELLNVSCLRLDINMLDRHTRKIKDQDRALAKKVLDRVGDRVSECVERLSAVNPDRALALHNSARKRLGPLSQLKGKGVDPCSMHYLVGNGQQSGRGGFCTDVLPNTDQGPRLVVVPPSDELRKFAISKYEISWREVNPFCIESGLCAPVDDVDLPVTGLSITTIERFTEWLSVQTGYKYRLPTADEWLLAAQGEPDPNRNCAIDVGGIKRGDGVLAAAAGSANPLGLVHVLGNVQELVKATGDYAAAGGAFADPIDRCLASTHREALASGDDQTGFRLVREVS